MPITTTIAVVLPRIQKNRRCNRLRPCTTCSATATAVPLAPISAARFA